MLKCSQCNCVIEPIDLDGGYYIEESLHPHMSRYKEQYNQAMVYASEQRGCAGDLWWRIPVA